MGARGFVTYEDEFELDSEQPWYTTDAPETGDGPVRKVIVFRLRPMTIEPRPSRSRLDVALNGRVTQVPIEQQWTEKVFIAPSHEERPGRAQGAEARRCAQGAHLTSVRDTTFSASRSLPDGEAKPIFCDLRDATGRHARRSEGLRQSRSDPDGDWPTCGLPPVYSTRRRRPRCSCPRSRAPTCSRFLRVRA